MDSQTGMQCTRETTTLTSPLIWPIESAHIRRFWRNDGTTRDVLTDRVAVLSHSRCAVKRGLTGCYPWVTHVVFLRPDGTLGCLCNAKAVMKRSDGWWAMDADVLAILRTGNHVEPLMWPAFATDSGQWMEVAGHRLCTRCELVLDHINRITQRQRLVAEATTSSSA